MRGSKAWLRPRPARRRRAHPLASARAGEQAATAPSRSLPQATMASGRRRRIVWREKGEERMTLGFGARRRRRGFVLAKTADDRPIVINGRESVSPSGPASGPCGRGRGRRGGPFRRPGRWLSGLGPKERWPSRPRAGFASGPPKQCSSFYCFFYFSRSNFNSFLNGFDYSLISIQFCTNVFIV